MIDSLKKHKFIYIFMLVASIIVGGTFLMTNAKDEAGKISLEKNATKVYEGVSEDNLEKGRFAQVTLDVNAKSYDVDAKTKLDIVLVIDNSSSMDNEDANEQNNLARRKAAKDAASDFVDNLINEGKDNVKIGIVVFGTDIQSTQQLSSNKTTINDFISGISSIYNQGTNVQAGIAKANELLTTGRSDAKKVVIVLTDGEPTYFNYTYTYYENVGSWSNPRYEQRTGTDRAGSGSDNNSVRVCYAKNKNDRCTGYRWVKPSEAAKSELDSLKSTYSDADVYTIAFGKESGNSLSEINPASSEGATPIYVNYSALTGDELKAKFDGISDSLVELIGKDSVVTDIIPKEFKLTESAKIKLTEQGIDVVENEDGTTKLTWNIGNINANTDYKITYEVKALDNYYGSIYTNQNASLTTTVDDNNPYYKDEENKTITLEFEKPNVAIPMITKDDHYSEKTSYVGYAESTINGESVLDNDLNENLKTDENVRVSDKVIIVENDDTKKISEDKYEISKDGVKQGTLVMNDNGTFTFVSEENVSGEVEFLYYVETTLNPSVETGKVVSAEAKVTLNVLSRSKVNVSGEKVWDDANNQDGLRPTSINITLNANGVTVARKTLTSTDWTYSFDDLYKYQVGHENDEKYLINYEVKEVSTVDGYVTTYDGNNIINKHIPEVTGVSGQKTWDDNNNQDGIRPTSIKVKVFNGLNLVAAKDVTEADGWSYSFDNLPKYENGSEIEYQVKEDSVDGYETVITGNNITNTHSPEKTNVTGRKVWQDANNQDGVRPASIIVKLYADGTYVTEGVITEGENKNWAFAFTDLPKYNNGTEIEYTVKEESVDGYTTAYGDNNTIINTHETSKTSVSGTKTWNDNNDQDGKRPESITVRLYANGTEVAKKDVTAEDGWAYSFDELDKYAEGKEINYTITEDAVDGYSTEINGYDITNTHEVEKISVSGTKIWDDNDNQDGKRPESITVRLYANGTEVAKKDVTAANGWTYSFDELDKYAEGKEINYTITEDTVDGYEKEVTGYDVTNTHVPEKITFKATKVWDDKDNQDGIRPESIKVYLYKNDEVFKTAVISAENNWTYSFDELDRYANGVEISYKIVEEEVDGYSTEINYDEIDENNIVSSTITNTHTPEKIDITINKTWDDKDNYDGLRPIEITVDLFKDGILFDTIIINENDNWQYQIKDLDKYANGTEILYTILEHPVAYYETMINGFDITNTHKVVEGKGSGYEIEAPNTGVDTNSNDITYIIKMIFMIISLGLFSKKILKN